MGQRPAGRRAKDMCPVAFPTRFKPFKRNGPAQRVCHSRASRKATKSNSDSVCLERQVRQDAWEACTFCAPWTFCTNTQCQEASLSGGTQRAVHHAVNGGKVEQGCGGHWGGGVCNSAWVGQGKGRGTCPWQQQNPAPPAFRNDGASCKQNNHCQKPSAHLQWSPACEKSASRGQGGRKSKPSQPQRGCGMPHSVAGCLVQWFTAYPQAAIQPSKALPSS